MVLVRALLSHKDLQGIIPGHSIALLACTGIRVGMPLDARYSRPPPGQAAPSCTSGAAASLLHGLQMFPAIATRTCHPVRHRDVVCWCSALLVVQLLNPRSLRSDEEDQRWGRQPLLSPGPTRPGAGPSKREDPWTCRMRVRYCS